MKKVTIPDDVINTQLGDINLHCYENRMDIVKCQVAFSQNVFSFLVEGYKEIYHSNSPVQLDSKGFTLISAPHCLMTEKRTNPSAPYKSILLFFNNKALDAFKMKYQSLFNINKEKQHNLIYTFQYDPYCFHFRTSLELLLNNTSTISSEILQAKFEEIMLYLLQKEPEKIRQLLASNVPDFEFQFKSIVENNIHSQLSLDELAFLCNMSISTFKRYFSQYYQTTPKKWFIAERMKTAAYLLQNGERPIDIYAKVGYKSLSNFIRAYRNHFQIAPKQQQQMNV